MTDTIKVDEFITFSLGGICEQLEKQLEGDVLLLKSPIYRQLDDIVRNIIENLVHKKNEAEQKEKSARRKQLIVLLETTGGYIDVVERISNVFRHHYERVDFIVPNYAYSAGTVLALSGDRIYMDYYSVLGPIDPQVQNENGKFIPGMGYLYKFQELISKKNLTNAEIVFLAKRFDPAELFVIEQSKNHSEELIRKWLVQFKFKDWAKTATRGRRVTLAMKERRAADIASILGNAEKWHSHGRGISIRELQGSDINLLIDNFGDQEELNDLIKQYYDLFIDYCAKIGTTSAIHTRYGLRRIG